MEIIHDKNIYKELETSISYYIRGLLVSEAQENWIFDIQRITEHSLVKYSRIDLRKENFLEYFVTYKQRSIEIRLNNSNCKYRNNDVEISISIPFIKTREICNSKSYELYGDVIINIKKNKRRVICDETNKDR